MLVKITWDRSRVVKQEEGYVVLACDPHQMPMLPAWICTLEADDLNTPTHEGRYLNISRRGGFPSGRSGSTELGY